MSLDGGLVFLFLLRQPLFQLLLKLGVHGAGNFALVFQGLPDHVDGPLLLFRGVTQPDNLLRQPGGVLLRQLDNAALEEKEKN